MKIFLLFLFGVAFVYSGYKSRNVPQSARNVEIAIGYITVGLAFGLSYCG